MPSATVTTEIILVLSFHILNVSTLFSFLNVSHFHVFSK